MKLDEENFDILGHTFILVVAVFGCSLAAPPSCVGRAVDTYHVPSEPGPDGGQAWCDRQCKGNPIPAPDCECHCPYGLWQEDSGPCCGPCSEQYFRCLHVHEADPFECDGLNLHD